MKAYKELLQQVVDEGTWVLNERTGKWCRVVPNVTLTYDCHDNGVQMVTTRKCQYSAAIAEMIGFMRGYTNAADFRKLGTKTWDANANANADWIKNPNRKGKDDLGLVYGAVGNAWPVVGSNGTYIDSLKEVVKGLLSGEDNRGLIWSFWNPGIQHLGCLRPCMYDHHFTVIGDELYLRSTQRSADVCLGLVFNIVQTQFLLILMAQITGLRPAKVLHVLDNAHVYDDQYRQMVEMQLPREPIDCHPKMIINPDIKTLDDVRNKMTLDDVTIAGYDSHPVIRYNFSV